MSTLLKNIVLNKRKVRINFFESIQYTNLSERKQDQKTYLC